MSRDTVLWSQLIQEYKLATIRYPALKPVTLAQWAVESGRGSSALARRFLNFGGLKFRERMVGYAEPVSYEAHDGKDTYCRFADIPSFFRGYWHFIASGPYNGWENYGANPQGYLKHIAAKGYAADKKYLNKVLSLIPEAEAWLGLKSNGSVGKD